MIDKLEEIKHRFEEVGQLIVQPDIVSDMKKYSQLNKEYKDLEKIVTKYDAFVEARSNLANAKEILSTEKDQEFREMAKAEIDELEPQIESLEEELKVLLIPKDPNDSKNVILEIRAGTGGDEASIFAGDLFRMYKSFAESEKWTFAVLNYNEGSAGGYKEIVASIEGEDVYGKLKFESGAHRVQKGSCYRVPRTSSYLSCHSSSLARGRRS